MEVNFAPCTRVIDVSFNCVCGEIIKRFDLEFPYPTREDVNRKDEVPESYGIECSTCGKSYVADLYRSTKGALLIIAGARDLETKVIEEDI